MTRVVSGTEGSGGNAFTTLMTAVATSKPVMVFSLTLIDGRLLPEIYLNSDTVAFCSESAAAGRTSSPTTLCETAYVDQERARTNNEDSDSSCLFGLSVTDSWNRECRLPGFSFSAYPGLSGQRAVDVSLKIRTNIPPKVNVLEDRCDGFPIHHSLLKSMLQKAVRRRITDSVIRLSLALAHVSTLELLRYYP